MKKINKLHGWTKLMSNNKIVMQHRVLLIRNTGLPHILKVMKMKCADFSAKLKQIFTNDRRSGISAGLSPRKETSLLSAIFDLTVPMSWIWRISCDLEKVYRMEGHKMTYNKISNMCQTRHYITALQEILHSHPAQTAITTTHEPTECVQTIHCR